MHRYCVNRGYLKGWKVWRSSVDQAVKVTEQNLIMVKVRLRCREGMSQELPHPRSEDSLPRLAELTATKADAPHMR